MLDILKRKAAQGVEIKVLYDDIGCMLTLPGDYHKILGNGGLKQFHFPDCAEMQIANLITVVTARSLSLMVRWAIQVA